MIMKFMPKESGQFIAQLAQDVSIEDEGVLTVANELVKKFKKNELSLDNYSQHIYHPDSITGPKIVDWLLVLDTLNFCFWNDPGTPKWTVNETTGYFALCSAVKRAIDAGIPMTDCDYMLKVTREELEEVLKGDAGSGEIPLLDERVKNLNEVGRVLKEKYNGTFVNCIEKCQKSAEKLLNLIVTDFPCFKDEAEYKTHEVSFYKRAQILIADIWCCFKGKNLGAFSDIDFITMFADYRVPQVLLHFKALKYSSSLMEKLRSNTILEPGSEEEIEIRGCSIEAVERVREKIEPLFLKDESIPLEDIAEFNSIVVDFFLWEYRRENAKALEQIPFHKTRTIFY